MYISIEQEQELDKIIKKNEVALRSFIADIMVQKYQNIASFSTALQSISISNNLIYSKRFSSILAEYNNKPQKIYNLLSQCKTAFESEDFNNNVPYVSDLINLLLLFFNVHFSNHDIVKKFSSIEEFHYCCTLYHKTRNNLSHPASHPTTENDANKIIYFINNLTEGLEDKYYWYSTKSSILSNIEEYRKVLSKLSLKHHNLNLATSTHKNLLCREEIIKNLYDSLLGNDVRQRVAGSIVLYGYGGVGKTAITTEFLYRLMRDKMDGKYPNVESLLFYSSKDEYLRENETTGEFYIDSARPEFENLEDLKYLMCQSLELDSINDISSISGNVIIAIDNLENIIQEEKTNIINFTKSLPRSIQFIITSRNEELCEEKIHIEEFKNDDIGIKFVIDLIESEEFDVAMNKEKAQKLLIASKGNSLIIVQILNIITRGVSTFDDIIRSLDNVKSKNTEIIANFMYKNTFDNALKYLDEKGYPVHTVMQIISLYHEKIELYSISKLAKIDVVDAEKICNYLLERLVLRKTGEYYELNEFAKRFVFIKLLPDRFELSKINDKIKNHKARMKEKISQLDDILEGNSALYKNMNEWQPKNYIDKIIIAELFSIYGKAKQCVYKNDKIAYEKCLKEFDDHSFITNHPYVPLQNARILMEGYTKFYRNNKQVIAKIENSYEQAIDAIEYEYRYLNGSLSHASLLMFFGIFLSRQLKEYSRAIRFLEESKKYYGSDKGKGWFTTCNYLSYAYLSQYEKTNDEAYNHQLQKVAREVIKDNNFSFDTSRYEKKFSYLVK